MTQGSTSPRRKAPAARRSPGGSWRRRPAQRGGIGGEGRFTKLSATRILDLAQPTFSPQGLATARVEAAAVLACRLTRAQGFTEGNKRTGLLLAQWVLDRNDVDGATLLPPDDRQFADLLVKAASGLDVEDAAVALLRGRRSSR